MGKEFAGTYRLDQYMRELVTVHGRQRLAKITLPQIEWCKVIDLCNRHGITAATMHPDFYGAAKATKIALAVSSKSKISGCSDVQITRSPALRNRG